MPMRLYGTIYRDNDSLKNVLTASLHKGNEPELKNRGVLIINGYYMDSAGVRYYFAQDKSPWSNMYGKILKTIP